MTQDKELNDLLYRLKSHLKNIPPKRQRTHAEAIISMCYNILDDKE